MAKFWMITTVTVGGNLYRTGRSIDDSIDPYAAIVSVGGSGCVFPQGNSTVDAAAATAAVQHSKGASDTDLELIMQGAVDASTVAVAASSGAVAITAGTTRTQAGGTALVASVNRVDTSTAPAAGTTLGDGVVLPAAGPGKTTVVINNTANLIQVYGNGADTINGIAGVTGVPIAIGDVAIFESGAAGSWNFDGGMGASGALPLELACDTVSATGSTQGTAAQLVAAFNRITVATAGSAFGVKLPASAGGLDVIVENHSGVSLQVYGAGTDQIDDVATATGVVQMDSSVVIFTCYAPGKWYSNGLSTGYAKNSTAGVVLETTQFADALTATGTTQATGFQMLAQINTFSTVAAGAGANLPASAPGLSIIVQNNGVSPLQVYPFQGAADTINGVAAANGISLHPGTTAVFNCTSTGAWTTEPSSPVYAVLNGFANTDANQVLTAAQISGAVAAVDLQCTGAITAGRNLQLPTVAALVLAMHAPAVGASFRLRITNFQSGAFPFTVVTNTGWTLTGTTFTVAQNGWREFVVQLTSLTTATIKPVATGTFS